MIVAVDWTLRDASGKVAYRRWKDVEVQPDCCIFTTTFEEPLDVREGDTLTGVMYFHSEESDGKHDTGDQR